MTHDDGWLKEPIIIEYGLKDFPQIETSKIPGRGHNWIFMGAVVTAVHDPVEPNSEILLEVTVADGTVYTLRIKNNQRGEIE